MQWWPCEGKVYVKLDNTYVLVIISFVFCSNIRCILDFKDIAVWLFSAFNPKQNAPVELLQL